MAIDPIASLKALIAMTRQHDKAATRKPWWVEENYGDVCAGELLGEEGPPVTDVGPADWKGADIMAACDFRTAAPLLAEVADVLVELMPVAERWEYERAQTIDYNPALHDECERKLVAALNAARVALATVLP